LLIEPESILEGTRVVTVKRIAAGCLAAVLFSGVHLPAAGSPARVADAVEQRANPVVITLIQQGADVNAPQPDGATPLHWAAYWDDVPIADLLLRSGAKVNATNDYGVPPISLAATNGSASMVRRLLQSGADPNASVPTGETVLMTASRVGSLDVVYALLQAGASPNVAQLSKGQTALMWSIAEQHMEIARVLLAAGADVEARTVAGSTPLMFAAREGNVELARLLLDAGARVNESATDGSTPLLIATVRGHAALAMFLLERGAAPEGDFSKIGYTPLHWAAGRAESLMSFYYPDAAGEWAAMAGIPSRDGKLALIKALIAHGADVNARLKKNVPRYGFSRFKSNYVMGGTPFLLASVVADVPVMELLLAAGANPRMYANDGTTPLIVAAGMARQDNESNVSENDRVSAVTMLLRLGSDIEEANQAGLRAMHAAAYAGYERLLQNLVDRGAALNPKTRAGQTPLGIADGHLLAGSFARQPNTAALLRQLGAVSEGAVTLDIKAACEKGGACAPARTEAK
jgi:ankyrin repeat protein